MRRIAVDGTDAVLQLAGKARVQALEARFLGLAEVEVAEQAPQEDAGRGEPRLLDPAQPTHELREPAPRNAVGQEEIDVFLLDDAIDQGAGSHLNVIRLQ
jgi:hypothetical protein